jgi:hypothetical protein
LRVNEEAGLRKKLLLLAALMLGLGLAATAIVYSQRYCRTGSLRLMARG